ncbi:MAG: beta-lactamase family protein [Actinomycetota bacterium]|nr:beta-lactamase family protein [Actinomycetota bacterium]
MASPEPPLQEDRSRALFMDLEEMCGKSCCAHVDNLVVVAGSKVHTRSFHGQGVERPVDTYSLTKPVIASLVGCALEDGYLESIDVHVTDFLPAARTHHSGVRMRHLVTMTMSIAGDGFLDIDRIIALESSWVEAILSLPAEKPPGVAFSTTTEPLT